MTRILITFILVAFFATADIFAQRGGRQAEPQTQAATNATVVELDGILIANLPLRNDEAGIAARNILQAAQSLISPEVSEFAFMQPSLEEQRAWFQQAIDTLQTLLVFVNPPAGEAEMSPEILPYGEEPPAPFVPDAFVNAHYLLGMGIIYFNMMNREDLFGPEKMIDLNRSVATYFEKFAQNGIGASAFVHSFLATFYLWIEPDPRRALTNIDQAIALEPRYAFHHITRAQILQGQGYLEQACASLRRASQLGETMADGMIQSWVCP